MPTEITSRQREIKQRLERGMGAREIAEDLGITRNAVYQQIQRLRRQGVLEPDYTPTGQPPRETQNGATLLASLLTDEYGKDGTEVVASMALVEEMRRTRDDLEIVVRRLNRIVPR